MGGGVRVGEGEVHLMRMLCSRGQLLGHLAVAVHSVGIMLVLREAGNPLLLAHAGHICLGGLHHPPPERIVLAPAQHTALRTGRL